LQRQRIRQCFLNQALAGEYGRRPIRPLLLGRVQQDGLTNFL
jgi:hypothetical protein